MPDPKIDLIKGPFGLKDEMFWNKPLWQPSVVDFRIKLGDDLADGMFLDTPDRIYGDRHKTIPLAMVRSGPTQKLFDYNLRTTARLVVSHLETGNIQIVKPGEAGGPARKRPDSPGWTSTELEADLRNIMDLGAGLGVYQAFLICGPQISNRKAFALFPSPEAEKKKETLDALERLRKEGGSPARMASLVALDIRQSPPSMDEASGPRWKAALERVQDGTIRLDLDYSLPVLPRFVLPSDKPLIRPDGSRVRAILPVYLVGFSEDRRICLDAFLGLPVQGEPGGTPERPVLEGRMNLSLSSLLGKALPEGKLTLWAVVLDQAVSAEVFLGAVGKVSEDP
jgi:hypothetical protein